MRKSLQISFTDCPKIFHLVLISVKIYGSFKNCPASIGTTFEAKVIGQSKSFWQLARPKFEFEK